MHTVSDIPAEHLSLSAHRLQYQFVNILSKQFSQGHVQEGQKQLLNLIMLMVVGS